MYRCDFFNGLVARLDQWMGDLFVFKNLPPSEIYALDYHEMRYWHMWHEAEIKAKKKAANKKNG